MTTQIFNPVSTERASVQIVEQIQGAIRSGQLQVGARLPPERELAEQLSVSRVTVRDALRILEARGLITIRVGARGGAFVTMPTGDVVNEGLIDMLALSDLSAEEVTETRRVLEVGAVTLVCERATQEDFAALEGIIELAERRVADGTYDLVMSTEFHLQLLRATHNKAVVMLMEVLQDSMLSSLRQAREAAPQMGIRGVQEHREILEACKVNDVDRAREVMQAHLKRTAQRIIESSPGSTTDRSRKD